MIRKIMLICCFLVVALTTLTVRADDSRAKGIALHSGDTIGIAAPASPDEGLDISSAVQVLHGLGYKTVMAPNTKERDGFFAGTDMDRAAGVNTLFSNDDVKAIVCLNGGYGSARILDKLDYAMIAKHPKLLIGFSDITALHTALGEKAGIVTVHGPMMNTLVPANHSAYTWQQFTNGVTTTEPIGMLSLPPGKNLQTIIAGTAQGKLVGGNLTMLAAAAGTPYELKGDGAVLVLEDVNEDAYRIDRMMQQLWQNGLLKRVNAIVYGDFLNCGHDLGDFTTDDVLTYYAKLAGKPAIKGLPIGHGMDNAFLPLGVHAIVRASADGTATLTIDESHNKER